MGVFKKQGVYWIDYYVYGHRKRERIGADKRLAETVHRKRKVEIAEGKYLDRQRPITTTFDELAGLYLVYSREQQLKKSWMRDRTSLRMLGSYFECWVATSVVSASRKSRRLLSSNTGPGVAPQSLVEVDQ